MQDRYAPCRCGSGKKYKWCCLQMDRDTPGTADINSETLLEKKLFDSMANQDDFAVIWQIIEQLASKYRWFSTFDDLIHLKDALIYFDRTELFIPLIGNLRKEIKSTGDLMEWTQENFDDGFETLRLIHFIEQSKINDFRKIPELIETEQLDWDEDEAVSIMQWLMTPNSSQWQLPDFGLEQLTKGEEEVPEQLAKKIFQLCFEFAGYASRKSAISMVSCYSAAEEMMTYLVDRAVGELSEDDESTNYCFHDSRFFIPDIRTLEVYCASRINVLSRSSVFALVHFLDFWPIWFDFIQEINLVSTDRVCSAARKLIASVDQLYISAEAIIKEDRLEQGRARWQPYRP